jgi:hypothetical protein
MRAGYLVLLVGCVLAMAGCASTSNPEPHQEDVSSLPWNRPQRWEGQGMLGGMGGQ